MRWFKKKLKPPNGFEGFSYRTEFILMDENTLLLKVWQRTEPKETLIVYQVICREELGI